MHLAAADHSAEVDSTDSVTGLVDEAGWQAALRLEDRRAKRYGGHPAVLLVELGSATGPPSDATLARVATVVKGVTRDSDVVARVGPGCLAVLAVEGGAEVSYLAARLRVLLGLEGIRPTAIRTRSRAGSADLAAAWAAALADAPALSHTPSPPRRRTRARMGNTDFLKGLASELRLELALVAGVGSRLEGRNSPDLVELGHFLLRHVREVDSLLGALDLLTGKTTWPEPVDPAAVLRAVCDQQGVTVHGAICWAAPLTAHHDRLRTGFAALLEAVAPPGLTAAPVAVSDSGLSVILRPSGNLFDDTRRAWRLRLARRFIENEGGRLLVRATPDGPHVRVSFPGTAACR